MKNKLWVICILSGFISPLLAQNETAVLRNYKYRFQMYRASNFSFNSSFYSPNDESRDPFGNYMFGQNSRNLSLDGTYGRFAQYNSEEKIHQSSFSIFLNGESHKDRKGSNKNRSLNLVSNFELTNTYYKLGSLKFKRIHTEVRSGISDQRINNTQMAPIQGLFSSSHINGGFAISRGKGRIENIADASFAAFWLRDMRAKGVVKVYTGSQIEEVAKAITTVRNTRIMDFRFRTIDQIKMLDSSFRNMGILTATDALYYTTLYDHYLYANNYQRSHGRNAEVGLNLNQFVDHNYSFQRMSDTLHHYSYRVNNIQPTISIFYQDISSFALSIHSQISFNSRYEVGVEGNKRYSNIYSASSISNPMMNFNPVITIQFGFEYMYIHNTRNYVRTYLNGGLARSIYTNYSDFIHQVNGGVNYFHWFSPNLNLQANARFQVYKSTTKNINSNLKSYSLNYTPYVGLALNYVFY